ncbi:MAG: hypothetical protein O3B01_05675, partial [Planctomycetota bacterium]|nr:hypothetical protein [Planctomycetota bacterium]
MTNSIPAEDLEYVKEQVRLGALRWLHSLDLVPGSRTYGVADRDYWSWKTKDFPNGTWQGGLAGCLDARSLLALSDSQISALVYACLCGTSTIQRSNGSFEEAFPYESSYAVTALVLFNLMYAYIRHGQYFTPDSTEALKQIASKAYRFIDNTPETHGTISNHLATGLAARYLSAGLLELDFREDDFLQFASLQDAEEGWFPEYGGADPGYQSLLNHYLTGCQFACQLPTAFHGVLNKSIGFLESFCYPNGTFSGEIGSRGTSVLYPGGTWRIKSNRLVPSSVSTWFLAANAKCTATVT